MALDSPIWTFMKMLAGEPSIYVAIDSIDIRIHWFSSIFHLKQGPWTKVHISEEDY